jgi:ABC-type sugar transport system ATPase subunit
MSQAILEARGIRKSYPGVVALKGIDLAVYRNEILGLVGENGAGKSTLMKILIGLEKPDAGEIRLRGQKVELSGPAAAIRGGVGMVFQEGCLLPNLSIADNLFLCHEESFRRHGLLFARRTAGEARRQLEAVGLLGSGKEEVCRCLAGSQQPDRGTILLGGKKARFASPKDAIAAGIGCVPIDRRNEGLATSLDVASNINLLVLRRLAGSPLLSPRRERRNAGRWVRECLIKTPSLQTLCGNLSGGNQQKVVIAKWLAAEVRVLILDHPTRGIDVGAKDEIYRRIRELAAAGMSLIIMCDTLEEDIGLANRLIVMKDGKIVRELDCPRGSKPAPLDVIGYIV